jgi:vesicle coat complex subunit
MDNRSDAGLTNGVIRQLGLSKSRLPEAMDFISANLNKEDPYLRASAVNAVSRLDKVKEHYFLRS